MQAHPESPETADQGHDPVWSSRPRLRHDVLFADTGSGVLLKHAEASFVVKGRSAYRFFSALVPYLNGEVTVEELAGAVPAQQHPMLLGLVRTLLDRGFARNRVPEPDSVLEEPVRDRFQRQIDYVEHYADGAVGRFARFRDLRVLVVGRGPVAEWATLGLVRNGASAVDTAGPGRVPDHVAGEAGALTAQDCPVAVNATDLDPADLRAKDLAGYDAVLLADPHAPARVWRLCGQESTPPLLPVVVMDDTAVLGPFHEPEEGSCWNCGLLRYADAAPPEEAARLWRRLAVGETGADTPEPPAPQAAMLGNALAFEVFRWATGALGAETRGAVLVQDVRTLDTVGELVLPHPRCPRCRGRADTAPSAVPAFDEVRPEPDDDESVDRAYREAEHMVGSRTGLVTEHLDLDLTQSPLKVGRVALAGHGPRGQDGRDVRDGRCGRQLARADVHTTLRARLRTLRDAALRHAEDNTAAVLLPAPESDRAPVPLAAEHLGTATGAHDAHGLGGAHGGGDSVGGAHGTGGADGGPGGSGSAGSSGSTGPTGPTGATGPRAYGVGLIGRAVHDVPAAAVHPFSPLNADGVYEYTCAGEGAGSTPAYAVHEALLGALAFDGLRAALAGEPARPVDLGTPAEGSELGFLTGAAEIMDLRIEVLSLPGPAGAALVRETGSAVWEIGCGTTLLEAVTAALRDVIARVQLAEAGVADSASARPWAPTLDPRALPLGEPVPEGWAQDPAPVTAGRIRAELERQGREAVVVPTATPDLIGCGIHTVRVLLTAAGGAHGGEAE